VDEEGSDVQAGQVLSSLYMVEDGKIPNWAKYQDLLVESSMRKVLRDSAIIGLCFSLSMRLYSGYE
jgi:hypothetical protein